MNVHCGHDVHVEWVVAWDGGVEVSTHHRGVEFQHVADSRVVRTVLVLVQVRMVRGVLHERQASGPVHLTHLLLRLTQYPNIHPRQVAALCRYSLP